MEVLILFVSIYVSVGLYQFYKTYMVDTPIREAIKYGLAWPIDTYFELTELFKRHYIDKDGP